VWKSVISQFISAQIPIEELNGVGPARADLLRESGIDTILDLILDFPRRYVHRKSAVPICEVENGEFVSVLGEVKSKSFKRSGRLGTLTVDISDDTGRARLVFFKSPGWRTAQFERGCEVLVWGNAVFRDGKIEFHHPDYEFSSEGDSLIIPIYRDLENDTGTKLGKKLRNRIVEKALISIGKIDDFLPNEVLKEMDLPNIREAIEKLHSPLSFDECELARTRLAFDELLLLQLIFAKRRFEARSDESAPKISPSKKYSATFKNLPFKLTDGQNGALSALMENLTDPGRTAVLLSGDVGSGKTVVAVMAAVATADSGFQTAIVVPSLLVARQHADTISNLTRKSGISVGLLTGESQSAEIFNAIQSGAVDIIIGTQALLSNRVEFKNLGLVIIDEQHLMGVNQRLKLPKQEGAHVLLLSATPIPRSTALALFGDLDLVEMRDYPRSRAGTTSYLRDESRREAVWDFIEERISAGERAFVVYPRIDGDDFTALEFGFQKLRDRFGERVGFVHGGLDEVSKNRAIEAFRSGEISILAATTVVSVGIDIPKASVMLIEGADSFGLAQLHQLRGRVGRADKAGYCILITSKLKGSSPHTRLSNFTNTEDGFEISQIDLEERREGELLNIIQSGKNSLDFADPLNMPILLEKARRIARTIILDDPELKLHKNSALREIIHYIESSGEVVVTLA